MQVSLQGDQLSFAEGPSLCALTKMQAGSGLVRIHGVSGAPVQSDRTRNKIPGLYLATPLTPSLGMCRAGQPQRSWQLGQLIRAGGHD